MIGVKSCLGPLGIKTIFLIIRQRLHSLLVEVLCHVDDILVFVATPGEHDGRLWAVLE